MNLHYIKWKLRLLVPSCLHSAKMAHQSWYFGFLVASTSSTSFLLGCMPMSALQYQMGETWPHHSTSGLINVIAHPILVLPGGQKLILRARNIEDCFFLYALTSLMETGPHSVHAFGAYAMRKKCLVYKVHTSIPSLLEENRGLSNYSGQGRWIPESVHS